MGVVRWLRIAIVAALVALAVTAASPSSLDRAAPADSFDVAATSLSLESDEPTHVLATTRSADRPLFSDPRRDQEQDRGLLLALLFLVSGVVAASAPGRPRIRRGPRPVPAVSGTARLLRAPPLCLSL